nr:GntR family transcriptional regulator [uncultured Gemmiger sp.]
MEAAHTPDSIYHILEKEITELRIRPGEILSENSLCKRFGVSRTPIRSVLQRLEQNRFVRIVPCKGTIVTPIDLNIANQLIYRRVAIECMVLRDFIRTAKPTEVEEVRYHLELLQAAARELDDPEAFDLNDFLKKDLDMHELWFRATDKMFLWKELTDPQADYSRFIRLDMVGARNVPDVLADHTRMMEIIDAKDEGAIEPLLTHHLYGGVRRLGGKIFSEEYSVYFQPTEL